MASAAMLAEKAILFGRPTRALGTSLRLFHATGRRYVYDSIASLRRTNGVAIPYFLKTRLTLYSGYHLGYLLGLFNEHCVGVEC